MTVALYIRDTTWKEVTELYIRDGGAWKEVTEAYIRDGGAWKKAYGSDTITLSGETITNSDNVSSGIWAGVKVDDDGYMYKADSSGASPTWYAIDTATDWILPRPPRSTYYVRATKSPGSSSLDGSSSALDTWLSLDTDRAWLLQASAGNPGPLTTDLTIEISASSDGSSGVLDSETYSLSAEYTG